MPSPPPAYGQQSNAASPAYQTDLENLQAPKTMRDYSTFEAQVKNILTVVPNSQRPAFDALLTVKMQTLSKEARQEGHQDVANRLFRMAGMV